ncbi:hypothetical protein GW17_00011361, partial [Ensete ventricosum]
IVSISMMEELSLATGRLSSWWDEINESEKWQDGVFYFLCAAYAVVSSVALVTTSFPLSFYPSDLRAVEFGFHAQVFLFRPRVNVLDLSQLYVSPAFLYDALW